MTLFSTINNISISVYRSNFTLIFLKVLPMIILVQKHILKVVLNTSASNITLNIKIIAKFLQTHLMCVKFTLAIYSMFK